MRKILDEIEDRENPQNKKLPIIMLLLILIPMIIFYTFIKINMELKLSVSILYIIAVWFLDIYLEKRFCAETTTD